jgi:hypothetical protein
LSNQDLNAVDADGAVATWTATANDVVDGNLTPNCDHASGSKFLIGTTTVSCSATDAAGNTGSTSFTVKVADRTNPVIADGFDTYIEEGARGPTGIEVSWSPLTANDNVDGPLPVVCVPPSGSKFPVGGNTVACTATDAAGNWDSVNFLVNVTASPDQEPPVFGNLPNVIGVTATSSANTGVVTWPAIIANDVWEGPITATCTPPSGSTFPVYTWTTVTCTAIDSNENSASATFKVNVGKLGAGCKVLLHDGLGAGSCPISSDKQNGNGVLLKSGASCTYTLQAHVGFNPNENGYGANPSLSCLNGLLSTEEVPSLYRKTCPLPSKWPSGVDSKATNADNTPGSCGSRSTINFGTSCTVKIAARYTSPDPTYYCNVVTPLTGGTGLTVPTFTSIPRRKTKSTPIDQFKERRAN